MRIRIQKWGSCLALRIPKPFADEAGIRQGTAVDLSLARGRLVVVPVAREEWTLNRLLAGVTRKNLHGETDPGPPMGREVW